MVQSTISNTQPTIAHWLQKTTPILKAAGIESARLDCLLLVEMVLQKDREWLLAHDNTTIKDKDLVQLDNFITQRANHIPLAYLMCSKEFYGQRFFVNQAVLIPRPESEAIIELLCHVVKSHLSSTNEIDTIIDLGTGSGCHAITAKRLFPNLNVLALDNSTAALRVARKNARLQQVEIEFLESDLLAQFPNKPATQTYVILANLPYVPDGLITSEEIRSEPAEALFSGHDGLEHYQRFWQQVANLKHQPLYIIAESLQSQHKALTNLARKTGYELQSTDILVQCFKRGA